MTPMARAAEQQRMSAPNMCMMKNYLHALALEIVAVMWRRTTLMAHSRGHSLTKWHYKQRSCWRQQSFKQDEVALPLRVSKAEGTA